MVGEVSDWSDGVLLMHDDCVDKFEESPKGSLQGRGLLALLYTARVYHARHWKLGYRHGHTHHAPDFEAARNKRRNRPKKCQKLVIYTIRRSFPAK